MMPPPLFVSFYHGRYLQARECSDHAANATMNKERARARQGESRGQHRGGGQSRDGGVPHFFNELSKDLHRMYAE